MKSALFFLLPFLLLASPCQAKVRGHCLEPPGNNAIASMLVNGLEKFRPIMQSGNATVGIPVLDPYGPLPHLKFDFQNKNIRLDVDLDDVMIWKMSSFVICYLNLTLGLAQKFNLEVNLDEVLIEGSYDVDGIALGLFPIFGNGGFNLVLNQAGMTADAKITYNPLSDHAKIKELHFDVFFESLKLEMECILGCGDMANLVNSVASDLGKSIFEKVWGYMKPLMETNVKDAINTILKNIKISDLLPKEHMRLPMPINLVEYIGKRHEKEIQGTRGLGNANFFMDLIFLSISNKMVSSGLDPAALPDQSAEFMGNGIAKLYNGELTGLSNIHRSGMATIDKVADWVFLYTNFAFDSLKVRYTGKVEVDNIGPVVEMSARVSRISVYMMARKDLFGSIVDIDQFIITEFGKISVEIDGLGLLDYLLEPLSESVANALHDVIVDLLQTTIVDLIKDELQETPWPRLL